mmetsp:Transcript_14716/g.26485  ORF Transcript_14716/g.26485 Transcript_14716/m.26485 type:complete len:232 (+) Transcript_14716:2138-2833(+)
MLLLTPGVAPMRFVSLSVSVSLCMTEAMREFPPNTSSLLSEMNAKKSTNSAVVCVPSSMKLNLEGISARSFITFPKGPVSVMWSVRYESSSSSSPSSLEPPASLKIGIASEDSPTSIGPSTSFPCLLHTDASSHLPPSSLGFQITALHLGTWRHSRMQRGCVDVLRMPEHSLPLCPWPAIERGWQAVLVQTLMPLNFASHRFSAFLAYFDLAEFSEHTLKPAELQVASAVK